MLVKDCLAIPARKLCAGDVGVEIEVEGSNLPQFNGEVWRQDVDNSLRGESAEYVLAGPRSLAGVREALDILQKAYKTCGSKVDESVRAGVHIHINCQQLQMKELYNFFTLYLTLENVLIKYCGEYREGNLFCLRCQDAEMLLYQLIHSARGRMFSLYFATDDLRYAAMNVKALTDYGSLEFRAMRSTRDLDAVFEWASVLLTLREAAKKFRDPVDIIEKVSILGPQEFLSLCLGDFAKDFLRTQGLDGLLYDGVQLSQCLAYCTSWNGWEDKIVLPKPKRALGEIHQPKRAFGEIHLDKPLPVPNPNQDDPEGDV